MHQHLILFQATSSLILWLSLTITLSDLAQVPLIMITQALSPSGPLLFIDLGPPSDLGKEVPGMTVVTPRSGFDVEYYLNRVHGERSPGGYYLNAAQQGEAEGRWFGKGAQALGLRDGQQVKREPYLAVYNMIDPRTGEKLPGRTPGGYAKFAEILQRKLDAEPHATRERYLELERAAARETPRSPASTHTTLAPNTTVPAPLPSSP